MDGILNINKPSGITSHDVVMRMRRLLNQKKVGHTGTLDPLASGVLPLCIGQGTRIAQFISAGRKEYRAVVKLGLETDTLDRTGQILSQHEVNITCSRITDIKLQHYPVPCRPLGGSGNYCSNEFGQYKAENSYTIKQITREDIEKILANFQGSIEQIPPMFSALKKDGQRLYKLARKGITIERPPRQIKIYSLKLIDVSGPYFTLDIECSTGTYVRSLAADIGKELGCGAVLWELVRTGSGQFKLDNSISLEQAKKLAAEKFLSSFLISINQALKDFPQAIVTEEAVKLIQSGVDLKASLIHELPAKPVEKRTLLRLLSPEHELLAVGQMLHSIDLDNKLSPEICIIHPKLVFPISF